MLELAESAVDPLLRALRCRPNHIWRPKRSLPSASLPSRKEQRALRELQDRHATVEARGFRRRGGWGVSRKAATPYLIIESPSRRAA
eukprot:1471397-Alexandrium_andersonii.AAC.1